MDDPLSVVSADSSGTSDDFEFLDTSATNSPESAANTAKLPACSSSSQASLKAEVSQGSVTATSDNSLKNNSLIDGVKTDAQFSIANNGSAEDLQKQMNEVSFLSISFSIHVN